MSKYKVLVVEDDDRDFEEIRKGFDDRFEILWGKTLQEGEVIFTDNQDICLVIVDACVPGSRPTSMPLVKKICASGFTGAIIAVSGQEYFSKMLLKFGATHETAKWQAPALAIKILGL